MISAKFVLEEVRNRSDKEMPSSYIFKNINLSPDDEIRPHQRFEYDTGYLRIEVRDKAVKDQLKLGQEYYFDIMHVTNR